MIQTIPSKPLPTLHEIREGLHISYSQLNTYMLCSLKFYFAYVMGAKPEFIPAVLPFGSAIHETLASFYQAILVTGLPPSRADLLASFVNHWEIRQQNAREDVRFKANESWDNYRELGIKLAGEYYRWREEQGMPTQDRVVAVELPLQTRIGDIALIGAIDLILRADKDSDDFLLIDHKTAAQRYDECRIATDMQMTCYQLLIEENNYLPPEAQISLNWDVILKQKTPKVERYSTIRTSDDIRRFRKIVELVLAAIEAEVFFPSPGWPCADCGYRQLCASW